MAVISSILAGIGAAAAAIGNAVGGIVTSGALAGIWGSTVGVLGTTIGTTSITVGGALAAVGTAASAAISLGSMYQSARASAAMQQKQAEAIKKLQENQGEPEVARVNNGLQDNSRKARTLSSLRVSMLPQAQTTEDITRNVYGVDTNQVTTSTQNMVGLNIAAA